MKFLFSIILIGSSISLFGQGNCLIYPESSGERKACDISYEASEYRQGSRKRQILFDKAIAIGPNYAWAYYQKSVPYFKRGFLYEGLQLLNKAIDLDPVEHLAYRAIWYWQYKNYDLCIKDLERSYALAPSLIQFDPGGQKNMKIILGLAYAKNNQLEKGIETLEAYFKDLNSIDEVGLTDYHTLGVLYLKNDQLNKSIEYFNKQNKLEELISSHYYLGMAYKNQAKFKLASKNFKRAFYMIENNLGYRNPISGYPVYKSDIIEEVNAILD